MIHLSRPYDPTEHWPDDFLGRYVSLPELAHLPYHQVLERPITSVDDVLEFIDKTAMVHGYDNHLPKEKWGVWQARYLEAAWWRLQDAMSDSPRFSHPWSQDFRSVLASGDGPGGVRVRLEQYNSHGRAFLRDMSMEFFRGSVECPEPMGIPADEAWPEIAPDKQILGLAGVAERELFWKPVNACGVGQALSAWGSLRFGPRKFMLQALDSSGANPCSAFEGTFGPAAGAGLSGFLMNQILAAPSGQARRAERPRF